MLPLVNNDAHLNGRRVRHAFLVSVECAASKYQCNSPEKSSDNSSSVEDRISPTLTLITIQRHHHLPTQSVDGPTKRHQQIPDIVLPGEGFDLQWKTTKERNANAIRFL
jgi:hypothetical protein